MRVTDRDRGYWLLVVRGPLTMQAIRRGDAGTRGRLGKVLYDLKRHGSVRLIERGQHHGAGFGGRCGKWAAVQDETVPLNVFRKYRQLAKVG
jgi:hypothetical protein